MSSHSAARAGRFVLVAGLLLIAGAAVAHPDMAAKAVPDVKTAPGTEVPKDWWSKARKDIAQSEYNVTWQEHTAVPGLAAAWQAPNRAQNLRTYFTGEGPRVVRRTTEAGNWTWGLELTGFGRAGELAAPPAVKDVCAEGNRITFERDGLAEWYRNTEAGLEQGFTVLQAPESGDDLIVRMAVRGDLAADMMPDGQTVEFLSAGGVGVMRYGTLNAVDASGRTLPARLALEDGGAAVELRVDTANAAYPVTIDPLASSAAWMAESNQAGANLGWSVSTAGDVNGDGYSDVIVGAPAYDNGQTDEGRAFVYYGSSTGLSVTANWTAESNQASADFGWSVSTAGDVNGDGYGDVIVGAPWYDNGQTNEGRAYVYHGSASGLSATAAWTAESNQTNAELGISVSTAGDVNGDGYSDVIVGADYYDNGQTDEGWALVYYGSSKGLSTTPDWTAENNLAGSTLGYSVSTAGDVNGDGYSDIIVGAPMYSNGQTNEGLAAVYYGSSTGLPAKPSWKVESDQAGAYLGYSVSTAGDVNGDGYADVIVGAYGYDNGETDEGVAYVYYGSATGLPSKADWTAEGNQAGANFGWAVSTAGDVNGDGFADVIVGAKGYDNGQTDEGRAFVYYGSATGLSATANWTAESDQISAGMGFAVATAGDVNGDGYADIIVGAPYFDNGQTDEGRAFVYYGSASTPSNTANWTTESGQSDAWYGYSVSTAGDVNGDGYSDVIVGAPGYDNGQSSEGRVFLYYGSTTGLHTTFDWSAEGGQNSAWFGWSVATAGDVNGDGFADVIVGARGYSNGEIFEGRAFVYHGSASGLSATPNWTAESNQGSAEFGRSVATAGDVNGDGYSDVIVGAYQYYNGESGEGRAFVYHGSPSGLSATPNWTAESNQVDAKFGWSVSTAGDVNGDGYSDVIVGAYAYSNGQTNEGRAFVYYGSASGLSAAANWTAESDQAGAQFGYSVSTAGDVNGDGYADVIVGAEGYNYGQTGEGRAFVYYGSASGLSATANWTAEGHQQNAEFGSSVSTAGDVNGDGYSDVIVGAPYYDSDLADQGKAFIYYGSATGLSVSPKWWVYGNKANASLGWSVSTAGDVNGDGYSDVIVGVPFFDTDQTKEGRACVYYGNGEAGGGLSLNLRQRRSDNSAELAPMGATTLSDMRLTMLGRTPFGRSKVKLECEVKPYGTVFDGTATLKTASWTSTGVAGASFNQLISGLGAGVYHWRVRLLYNPAETPLQQRSRWLAMPWNSSQQGDFRVILPPPTAPSNPGATAIGTNTITWTWTDNSSNESGFKVWDDPGSGSPATLRYTTAAGTTAWAHGSLTSNTQYSFQVAATNTGGDSAKTALYSAWTLAAVPTAPTVNGATAGTLNVAIGAGDGNPATVLYGIRCTSTNQWVQPGGALGPAVAYQMAAVWGVTPVTGLAPAMPQTFAVVARNGAGIVTAEGPGASATTLAIVPNVVGRTQVAAEDAILGAGLAMGTETQQCDNSVAPGSVISQGLVAGQQVAPGSAMTLVLSTGLCSVTVPNVVGQTQTAAGTALTGANLTAGAVTQECSNTIAAGLVISQTPAAGGQAPYGSAVALVISTGKCTVTIPNVVGQTQSAAGTALVNAHLVTGAVTQQYSSTVAAGLVISQTPAAGGQAAYGSAVDLVVSKGAAPPMTGSIVINGNRSATSNPVVTLALTWAGGDGTGVVRMRFSNDGSTWTAWSSLQATLSYTLPAGDAHKTVRVQYLDKMNNKSAVFSDYILLDTTLPTGSITINSGASTTKTRAVTLGLYWADSGAGVSRMRFSDDGAHWTAWMPPTATRAYTLPAGLGNHTVRVQYLDGAGNYSAVYNDYIKLVAP